MHTFSHWNTVLEVFGPKRKGLWAPKLSCLFSVVSIYLVKDITSNKKPYLPRMHSNSRKVMQTTNVWDFMCFSVTSCVSVSWLTTFSLPPLHQNLFKLDKLLDVVLKYGKVWTWFMYLNHDHPFFTSVYLDIREIKPKRRFIEFGIVETKENDLLSPKLCTRNSISKRWMRL